MALKMYDVVCPECDEEFQVERAPAELATGEGELIECPACNNEWEWDYDHEADCLELCGDEDEDEDDAAFQDEEGDDE